MNNMRILKGLARSKADRWRDATHVRGCGLSQGTRSQEFSHIILIRRLLLLVIVTLLLLDQGRSLSQREDEA